MNFFLPRTMPGDPIDALQAVGSPTYAETATEETRAALDRYYGLDQPVMVQFGRYMRGLVSGDLGVSISHNKPVSSLLADRLPWTLLLAFTAVAISSTLGVLGGIHSAWRRGRPLDKGLLAAFIGPTNFPSYFIGSLALVLLAVNLGWFPLAGGSTAFSDLSWAERILDTAHHLVLPAVVLSLSYLTFQYLTMRASMVGELGSEYLMVGKAKGLRRRRLKYRYAARNALLPVVTLIALDLSAAMAASVLVERVFSYPGVGFLTFEAIAVRDYPVLQGAFVVTAVVVLTTNFLADVIYGRLDPRTTT